MQNPAEQLPLIMCALRDPRYALPLDQCIEASAVGERALTQREIVAKYFAPDAEFEHTFFTVTGADKIAAVLTMWNKSNLSLKVRCSEALLPADYESYGGGEPLRCVLDVEQQFRSIFNPLRSIDSNMWVELYLRPVGRDNEKIWVIERMVDHYTVGQFLRASVITRFLYLFVCIFVTFFVSLTSSVAVYVFPSLRSHPRAYRSSYSKPTTPASKLRSSSSGIVRVPTPHPVRRQRVTQLLQQHFEETNQKINDIKEKGKEKEGQQLQQQQQQSPPQQQQPQQTHRIAKEQEQTVVEKIKHKKKADQQQQKQETDKKDDLRRSGYQSERFVCVGGEEDELAWSSGGRQRSQGSESGSEDSSSSSIGLQSSTSGRRQRRNSVFEEEGGQARYY